MADLPQLMEQRLLVERLLAWAHWTGDVAYPFGGGRVATTHIITSGTAHAPPHAWQTPGIKSRLHPRGEPLPRFPEDGQDDWWRQTRPMPAFDTAADAANAAKKTRALLRDARGLQRRLDRLAAGMADASAPAQRSLNEARDAVARVIAELGHEEHAQRRATQQALRRRR